MTEQPTKVEIFKAELERAVAEMRKAADELGKAGDTIRATLGNPSSIQNLGQFKWKSMYEVGLINQRIANAERSLMLVTNALRETEKEAAVVF
jgi:hypothetical protein